MDQQYDNEEYDVILIGTGLTECILSAILSCHGKKVLHLDKNNYYGGECGSLSLDQAFEKFKPGTKAPTNLGRNRDYNIDMVPKFPLSKGNMMKAIVHTGCTRYLEFHRCKGAYVTKKGKPYKVPSNSTEAAKTDLVGFFQKLKLKSFLEFVAKVTPDDKSTWNGMDLKAQPMSDVYKKFGLDKDTQEFCGHAMALHLNEEYLTQPALPTIEKIRLYGLSVATYGDSPYLYPKYGIGDMGQGFARLGAVYGGLFILERHPTEINYGADGNFESVKCEDGVPKAKHLVTDPTYFPEFSRKIGKVARKICILSHPVANTENADSGMVIIPQSQLGRKHDIYLSFLSSAHMVCPKGKFLAFISTFVETDNPEKELDPAMALLGNVEVSFFRTDDILEPIESGKKNIHVSRSIDATSHFETIMDDVFRLYKELTGEDLDLAKEAEEQEKTRRAAGVPVDETSAAPTSSTAAPAPPPPLQEAPAETPAEAPAETPAEAPAEAPAAEAPATEAPAAEAASEQ